MHFLDDGLHNLKEGDGTLLLQSYQDLLVGVDLIFFDEEIVVCLLWFYNDFLCLDFCSRYSYRKFTTWLAEATTYKHSLCLLGVQVLSYL